MQIDYTEFDIDGQGEGVMYITCQAANGWRYYIQCNVFFANGLVIKRETCQLIDCMNDDEEPADTDLLAIDILNECLAQPRAISLLKTKHWHQCRNTVRRGADDAGH